MKITDDDFLDHRQSTKTQQKEHGFFENIGQKHASAATSFTDPKCMQKQDKLSNDQGFHNCDAEGSELDAVTLTNGCLIEQERAKADEEVGRDHEVLGEFVLQALLERHLPVGGLLAN